MQDYKQTNAAYILDKAFDACKKVAQFMMLELYQIMGGNFIKWLLMAKDESIFLF